MGSPTVHRVLGLDPGTTRTGFGVIEGGMMIECGLINVSGAETQTERLLRLSVELKKLLIRAKPDSVAVEQLFFATNSKTAMAVAEARGVIVVTCAQAGFTVAEYTPLQIKQSVSAYGQASKAQVATMVCKLLKLKATPKPDDVTDALAVALCHQHWGYGKR